jgi:hypothetical protein
LRTINPDLLNLDTKIADLKIDGTTFLSDADYFSATGERKKTPEEYKAMATIAANKLDIDYCVFEAIFALESLSNPGAIGRDENVGGTRSNRALVSSGKAYSGGPAVNNKNDNDTVMQQRTNQPDLGLDWRFSQGIGLMQVTLFPAGYDNANTYQSWAVSTPAFDARKTPNTRVINGTSYTATQLLKAQTNIEAGGNIWLDFYKNRCSSNVSQAFGAYNSGSCNKTGHNNYRARAMDKYNACCKEESCKLNK